MKQLLSIHHLVGELRPHVCTYTDLRTDFLDQPQDSGVAAALDRQHGSQQIGAVWGELFYMACASPINSLVKKMHSYYECETIVIFNEQPMKETVYTAVSCIATTARIDEA